MKIFLAVLTVFAFGQAFATPDCAGNSTDARMFTDSMTAAEFTTPDLPGVSMKLVATVACDGSELINDSITFQFSEPLAILGGVDRLTLTGKFRQTNHGLSGGQGVIWYGDLNQGTRHSAKVSFYTPTKEASHSKDIWFFGMSLKVSKYGKGVSTKSQEFGLKFFEKQAITM